MQDSPLDFRKGPDAPRPRGGRQSVSLSSARHRGGVESRTARSVAPIGAATPRPWPRPRGPWVMAQRWSHLLFAHWAVDPECLRSLVPRGLTLDLRDGAAWVSITPFMLSRLRPRAFPPLPWLSRFAELNLRTYVSDGRKPGVYFFSLDASHRLAVLGARRLYNLPYFRASMRVRVLPDGTVHYASRRHAGPGSAEFIAAYRPAGPPRAAEPASLDHWLTERYCLYAVDPAQRVHRTDIQHEPWALQPVDAEIGTNTVAAAAGITLPPQAERMAFARRLDVRVWWPTAIGPARS